MTRDVLSRTDLTADWLPERIVRDLPRYAVSDYSDSGGAAATGGSPGQGASGDSPERDVPLAPRTVAGPPHRPGPGRPRARRCQAVWHGTGNAVARGAWHRSQSSWRHPPWPPTPWSAARRPRTRSCRHRGRQHRGRQHRGRQHRGALAHLLTSRRPCRCPGRQGRRRAARASAGYPEHPHPGSPGQRFLRLRGAGRLRVRDLPGRHGPTLR